MNVLYNSFPCYQRDHRLYGVQLCDAQQHVLVEANKVDTQRCESYCVKFLYFKRAFVQQSN